jgi:protein phosphatase 1 regulatory subunit 3A/B/C/D/E
LQPRSQLTNEAADSYFDFDMEPESPGSPIDECEYTRLIETTGSTPQEQAPESGFVCASPCSTLESRGSASSSDVQFFDPESSDTGTEFFDCPTIEQARPARRIYQHLSHNKIAVRPSSPVVQSPSSSSSSATPTSKININGHVRLLECDSSESLPPSQSSSSNLNCEESGMSTANSNSNSTLQDADGIADEVEVKIESDENEKCTLKAFNSSRTVFVKYNEQEDDDEELPTEKENSSSVSERQFDQEKVLEEITTVTTENVSENKELTSDLEDEAKNDKENEMQSAKKDSDEESEYERPPRVRRCSSLKTGKTPPGTPGRKKIVRFADVLGLDLADVRTFLDEVPKIPKSAYEDLDVTLPAPIQLGPPLDKVLVPLFQQPGCLPNFFDRLREGQVCLENAAVTDPINLTITGCVRVRNLDYHKSVHIRYSLDNWRSYSDLTASYVENSCDGFSDKFSFILFGNSLQIGQRLEMATRVQMKGEQYWDSNYGINYCFQCLPCNTHRPEPVISSSESDLSSGDVSGGNIEVQSSSHIDALGHQQWSNSFLY